MTHPRIFIVFCSLPKVSSGLPDLAFEDARFPRVARAQLKRI
jgi:hypothetical protein